MDKGGEKRCKKCEQLKPATLEFFSPQSTLKDGLHSHCKECKNLWAREYRAKGKIPRLGRPPEGFKICAKCGLTKPKDVEHFKQTKGRNGSIQYRTCRDCVKADGRRYVKENKAKIAEYQKEYEIRNVDALKERRRRYRLENVGAIRERQKRARANDPARFKRIQANYAARYPERLRETRRRWQVNNREAEAAKSRNYRARKARAEGQHTRDDVRRQYETQQGRCWWCSTTLNNIYDVDHLIPLARGGSNAAENIVCACVSCNRSRAAKLPHEWNGRLL